MAAPALFALSIAGLWAYAARDMYSYNYNFISLGEVNIYPLVMWTLGLIAGYWMIERLLAVAKLHRPATRLLAVVLFYAVGMVIVETVGYHLLGVHNLGTSSYAGRRYAIACTRRSGCRPLTFCWGHYIGHLLRQHRARPHTLSWLTPKPHHVII